MRVASTGVTPQLHLFWSFMPSSRNPGTGPGQPAGAPTDIPLTREIRHLQSRGSTSQVARSPDATARALDTARAITQAGIPVFTAEPTTINKLGFLLPSKWEQTRPNKYNLDHWRLGMALCAVGGVHCDFIDIDPRNGGTDGAASVEEAGGFPDSYGKAATPSGGTHDIVAPLGIGKTKRDGIDLQGGKPDGSSRGFVFIAPTVRVSKVDGVARPYRWLVEPQLELLLTHKTDPTGSYFRDWITEEDESQADGYSGTTVYIGRFSIDAKHSGLIPSGQGHDKLVAFCGHLLRKYPDISWTDFEGLCHARWQEFDQSPFTWTWEECRDDLVADCWKRFTRGQSLADWVKTRKPRRFTGTIPSATSRTFAVAGR